MVIPNLFITFVRHSFHTSHSLYIPSRKRRHRPAPFLPPGATLPSWHTRCLTHTRTRLPHTLHLAKGYATRATHTLRILALTAHTPSVLPPLARAAPCRATTKHESHTPPRTLAPAKGYATHAATNAPKAPLPLHPLYFLRRKREPHNNQNITYYNITCNVYPNRSKDYTKKRGNLFLYRLNLLSLHDES